MPAPFAPLIRLLSCLPACLLCLSGGGCTLRPPASTCTCMVWCARSLARRRRRAAAVPSAAPPACRAVMPALLPSHLIPATGLPCCRPVRRCVGARNACGSWAAWWGSCRSTGYSPPARARAGCAALQAASSCHGRYCRLASSTDASVMTGASGLVGQAAGSATSPRVVVGCKPSLQAHTRAHAPARLAQCTRRAARP